MATHATVDADVVDGHALSTPQLVHALAPPVAYEPGAQAIASAAVESGQYDPLGHAEHALEPARLYEPDEHTTGPAFVLAHALPAGQDVQFAAAPSANEPSAHGTCRASTVDGQKKPGGQAVHAMAFPVA